MSILASQGGKYSDSRIFTQIHVTDQHIQDLWLIQSTNLVVNV